MTSKYDDIIDLPRHVSKKRPQMPVSNRAAQFSPFAALTGFDKAVKETARLTEDRIELDEYMKEALNSKLQIIKDQLINHPEVTVTYFEADEKKDGGAYVTAKARVKKIDKFKGLLVMENEIVISIDEIISIEGEIFATY